MQSIIVKIQIQPTVVILPLRLAEDVESCFNPHGQNRSSNNEQGAYSVLRPFCNIVI